MSIIQPIRTRGNLTSLDIRFQTFPDVQPFSARSAIGYQDLLESLYAYVTRDLYGFLTQTSPQTVWDANVTLLLAAIDKTLTQQNSDINTQTNAALQQVINSTIAVTDPVVIALLNNAQSSTAQKLASLYGVTDQKVHDALGTVTYQTLDGRYSVTDQMIHDRIGPVTFGTLDGRYAKKPASTAGRNAITGWWHVDDFGAVGDGVTDDRAAIQACIDAANSMWQTRSTSYQKVFFSSKEYRVSVIPYVLANGSQAGICSLVLKAGIELDGGGTIRLMDSQYGTGALYGVIRSDPRGLGYARIRNLTVNGNRANNPTSTQCSNILLDTAQTDIVIENVTSVEANGNSIMVVGTFASPVTNVRIRNNSVQGANTIGIQVSQFQNIQIVGNVIANTGDNGIDVYGENQGSTTSNGTDFQINNNSISHSSVGIFPETVANGTVIGNRINDCVEGVHVNRINGEPHHIIIADNEIRNVTTGMGFTGDTGGVTVKHNHISYFNDAAFKLGGAGRVSQYFITGNTCIGNSATIPLVLVANGTQQVNKLYVKENLGLGSNTPAFVNYATTSADITAGPIVYAGM